MTTTMLRALQWRENEGYLRQRVDDGEHGELRCKTTPMLVPDGTFDAKQISRLFEMKSRDVDIAISGLVLRVPAQYAG